MNASTEKTPHTYRVIQKAARFNYISCCLHFYH